MASRAAGLPGRACTDREALEALLGTIGLAGHAHRLAHDVAGPGLLLEPAPEGGTRGSRLGGPPVLPHGAAWPRSARGAPLSFLAALDASELETGELPAGLADAGWLIFFADLDHDAAEGFVDEADNVEGAPARVLDVPVGAAPVDAALPATLSSRPGLVLGARPVQGRRLLTLPDGWESAALLGLDADAAQRYEELLELLAEARGGSVRDDDDAERPPEHWMGGLATGAPGHEPDEDTVLLLQISDDDELGFAFLDGGTIQFRIPADALARHEWSRIVAVGETC